MSKRQFALRKLGTAPWSALPRQNRLYQWLGAPEGATAYLDFRTISRLPEGVFTPTRASSATYFNSTGTLVSAATDVPRFDYDPSTLQPRGLLLEGARTNLVTHSIDLTAASTWAVVSATRTKLSGTTLGLFERTEIASNGATFHNARNSASGISVTSGTAYGVQVFFETAGTSGRLRVICRDNTGGVETLITGAVGSLAAGSGFAGNITNVLETNVGSGVVRLTFTYTPNFTGTLWIGVGPDTATAGQTCIINYVGCEPGGFPSSPIITTGATATRAADGPPTLSNLALIGFNALEGTILSSFETMGQNVSAIIYLFGVDGVDSIQYRRGFGAPAESINFSVVGSVSQAGLTVTPTNNFTIYKNAFAYKVNDFGASTNGAAVLTDTSGTLPSVSVLRLGGSNVAGRELFGWLRLFAYTPLREPNAVLPIRSAV